ncbi:aspartate/glutamate racemase family protein, partial [Acinetobacter baumannii]
DRATLHRVIYDELCYGVVSAETRAWLIDLIERARLEGADSVILGCTELGLLVGQADLSVPVCDTADAHVAMALDFILADVAKGGAARAA